MFLILMARDAAPSPPTPNPKPAPPWFFGPADFLFYGGVWTVAIGIPLLELGRWVVALFAIGIFVGWPATPARQSARQATLSAMALLLGLALAAPWLYALIRLLVS